MKHTPPRWDLTPLYQSIDDPQIGKDLSAAAMQARRFALRGQGKIAAMRPADFGKMIADYDRLSAKTDKVSAFAEMVYTAASKKELKAKRREFTPMRSAFSISLNVPKPRRETLSP